MALRAYFKQVIGAVTYLNERKGASRDQVYHKVADTNNGDINKLVLRKALDLGVTKGLLQVVSGKYRVAMKEEKADLLRLCARVTHIEAIGEDYSTRDVQIVK